FPYPPLFAFPESSSGSFPARVGVLVGPQRRWPQAAVAQGRTASVRGSCPATPVPLVASARSPPIPRRVRGAEPSLGIPATLPLPVGVPRTHHAGPRRPRLARSRVQRYNPSRVLWQSGRDFLSRS